MRVHVAHYKLSFGRGSVRAWAQRHVENVKSTGGGGGGGGGLVSNFLLYDTLLKDLKTNRFLLFFTF